MRILIKFIFKVLVIIVYRPKVVGKQNIPQNSAAILCPNHIHALDSAVIITMNKRKINALAKKELFKNFFIKGIANIFGIYPVNTKSKDINSIKKSLGILKNNELLMIFPEGTRNGLAKNIKPKKGAIKLSIKSGAPIIPIGIQGNFKLFRKIKVNIGEPIDYSKYKSKITDDDEIEKLLNQLITEIIRLTKEKI